LGLVAAAPADARSDGEEDSPEEVSAVFEAKSGLQTNKGYPIA
jgi:hypothetical protein